MLVVETLGDALAVFESRRVEASLGTFVGQPETEFEGLKLGDWAATHVRLPVGYHSEMSSPFLEAYSEIQDELYRLVALVRTGNGDIRGLSQDDRDAYQLRVRVQEGSSLFEDNLPDLLGKLGSEMVGKLSGAQIVIVILGLGLLAGSYFGASAYFEAKKEVQIIEIQSAERTKFIEGMVFASKAAMEQAQTIREALEANGEIAKRALAMADRTQEELLKGAAQTNRTIIGDNDLSRDQAKALTAVSRKRSTTKMVEQEMKVVDVNTSDPLHWTVVLEDMDSGRQFKMAFRDAMIEEQERDKITKALSLRGTLWFRLKAKYVGEELQTYEVMKVIEPPIDGE